ncbi:zinc ribbon-containing protein [Methanobrevibacter sp. OttesenSCG-928-K11]|nr:zinc ribbon-containing protein [Methanobrevibacter sp. OttesenSCG-928-K11]MDL2270787.1 zinc ribbon-containing protein [Methanobrevibacter sp. OttesenSCG-928-I08]
MIYSTKKVAPPGTYKCTSCGYELKQDDEGNILPCPKCENLKWEKLI